MTAPMPAAFIGHGSPMNALEANRYTTSWHALGAGDTAGAGPSTDEGAAPPPGVAGDDSNM
jgi:aromatic ring-opening dioxygenase catalytic subunit (LigB family)